MERIPFITSCLKCLQQLGLGQAIVSCWKFNLAGPSMRVQEHNCLNINLLPQRMCTSRKLGFEAEPRFESRHSEMGSCTSSGILTTILKFCPVPKFWWLFLPSRSCHYTPVRKINFSLSMEVIMAALQVDALQNTADSPPIHSYSPSSLTYL